MSCSGRFEPYPVSNRPSNVPRQARRPALRLFAAIGGEVRPGESTAYALLRSTRRRSLSVIAPHTPYLALVLNAQSRHSSTTGQPRQIRTAASVIPSGPGKKRSGSASRHDAYAAHGRSSSSSNSVSPGALVVVISPYMYRLVVMTA